MNGFGLGKVAAVTLLSGAMCFAQQTAGDQMKDAGHETKNAATDAGHATATTTKKVAHKTANGTRTATHKTVNGTKTAAHDTKKEADKVGDKITGKPVPPQ